VEREGSNIRGVRARGHWDIKERETANGFLNWAGMVLKECAEGPTQKWRKNNSTQKATIRRGAGNGVQRVRARPSRRDRVRCGMHGKWVAREGWMDHRETKRSGRGGSEKKRGESIDTGEVGLSRGRKKAARRGKRERDGGSGEK